MVMLVRQKITYEREKNGLSTRELAAALQVNRGTVSRWENGYIKVIPLEMLQKLADVFHISVDDLIGSDPQYTYLKTDDSSNQTATVLSNDENAMIDWYRHLSRKEQKLVSRLWSQS